MILLAALCTVHLTTERTPPENVVSPAVHLGMVVPREALEKLKAAETAALAAPQTAEPTADVTAEEESLPATDTSVLAAAVTTDALYIRRSGDWDAEALALVDYGTTVAVTGKSGGWYQVRYDGIEGYLSGDYLDLRTSGLTGYGQVTADALNLRSGAGTGYETVTSLPNGAWVSVSRFENGWFYVNGGILDWSYTGLAYNENGWFYVNGGILDWSYTGLASNENGWFYINGGILDWSYTGLASNDYGWFYVSGGMLDWGYTGMAYNDYGWWYVVDGTLDYTYTGFGVNEYGSWLYCDGRIRFDYTGNARRGTTIYVIEAGRVTQTIEMQLNLSTDSEYYKYEYAYKTGDTSVLETDSEKAFYDGLSSYLDAAYAYATPYEQELAVHNYMVLNSEYDYYNYINGTIPYVSHTAEGIFVNRTAVCDGYSSAFKLCMDILGIPCEIITGEGDGAAHAWNAVMLDGEWYMVDVTWDDPVPDNPGVVNYDYFNITDEKMRRDHSYTSDINANGTKYNYYAQQENYFTNTTDYYEYLNKKLSEVLESGVENATVVIYVESLDAPIDNEFRSAYTDYSKVTVKHHSLGTSSSYGSYVMRITWRIS